MIDTQIGGLMFPDFYLSDIIAIPFLTKNDKLVIRKEGNGDYIREIKIGKHKSANLRIDHDDLVNAGEIIFTTSNQKK